MSCILGWCQGQVNKQPGRGIHGALEVLEARVGARLSEAIRYGKSTSRA